MRGVFSSLFRSLVMAAFGSRRSYFRPEQAEFPATHQSFDFVNRPFRGRCVAGCASIDALRLTNNSVNIDHQHEISFIRETSAPFARKFPPKGRSPVASSKRARQSPQENLLATVRRLLQQRRRRQKAGQCQQSQWFSVAATATTARAAAPA